MKTLTLFVLLALATPCLALDDTPDNRSKAADGYLAAVPPAEMINTVLANVTKSMPEAQRAMFRKMMTDNLDIPNLALEMKKSMVKIFTADELQALSDFYGSPAGKSIKDKMGPYMADLMPTVQSQMQAAMKKATQSRPKKETTVESPSSTP